MSVFPVKRNILVCLLAMLIFKSSYSQDVVKNKLEILRLNPEEAKGTNVSNVFSEIEFIPLENKKESVFGRISQLDIVGEKLVIYDSDTESVLIFLNTGKFVARINAKNIPVSKEKVVAQIGGFKIIGGEMHEKQIEVIGSTGSTMFDLNGILLKKEKHSDLNYADQFKLKNGTSVFLNYFNSIKDSTGHEIVINTDSGSNKLFFPINRFARKRDHYIRGGKAIYESDNHNLLYYSRYYDYSVYQISSDGVFPIYRIVFPSKNSLPDDFMTNSQYQKRRLDLFENNKEIFFGISNLYKCGNNLFLNANNWDYDLNKKKEFVYSLTKKELISIKDLRPDDKSFYLPITDSGIGYDFTRSGFHTFRDGNLYTSYSSLLLFQLFEQNLPKKIVYSERLTDYFKTGLKQGNPILIRLKPKFN